MQPSFPVSPAPVDSIVIKESSSDKPTTTLLHSSNITTQHQHHLYNYWTLNDRLRSKNEKLVKRQQSSCRLAFYSMWLFLFAGVMIIIVYRFTDECSLTTIDRKHLVLRCFRHILFLAAICISFFGFSGLIFGACRYFRSQPKPLLRANKYELHVTPNYDELPTINTPHRCCYQTSLVNGASILPSQQISNQNDEHSNTTVTSSVQTMSPQRKVPPFTYDELPPPTQSSSPLRILPNVIVNSTSPNHHKSAFVSSSTSASSSSPQSNISTTILTNIPNTTISSNDKRQSTLTYEDACASTPTSYTTCACSIDVWERQQSLTIPLSPR